MKAILALFLAAGPAAAAAAEENLAPGPACVVAERISDYKIESDTRVRLSISEGDDIYMMLKDACPQLKFHGYMSYTPLNGRLCAGRDDIMSRAGVTCRIASFYLTHPKEPAPGSR
ncbi:hypothetical protein [Pseudokordiimonas caeni]|uniref:hypothetical protein n=1 Tax=Pseudokordiimonas caeni TaxID=2997908 RepID=UPI002811636C|nr:hypothetical protein [Pseudokordiimonas caeni]